ncbi:VRR-NUC domain-containing protein [Pseudomonas sp. Marseille-QA0892]
MSPASVDNPLYYLLNFRSVLEWVRDRHGDLLLEEELAQIASFLGLSSDAQALLTRMIMRKGDLFRLSKLEYDEVTDRAAALDALLAAGWVETGFEIDIGQLFRLCTRAELTRAFGPSRGLRKEDWLAALQAENTMARPFECWLGEDCLLRLHCMPLCDRIRLMFFGNLRQTWSDFVLADLGIHRYEAVSIDARSRGFSCRDDIDSYLHVHRCRERFESGEDIATLLADLPERSECAWLDLRLHRLTYLMAQQCERSGELDWAEALYQECDHVGARSRRLRVLERLERYDDALAEARIISMAPRDEAEVQHLERIMPRLERKLGQARSTRRAPVDYQRLDLSLPHCGVSVEQAVALHLTEPHAPVFYVENLLINALFGLLCWEAIFAPVPGAFFHPFHAGPVDLYEAGFRTRRQAEFERCFAMLDAGTHRDAILGCYQRKHGLMSPFVHWGGIDEALLETALDCIPPRHLREWFERLLRDVKANRTGMPDLIQFWPDEKRYRMIEVKGPGDRLQDNQLRWLAFCAKHEMPVTVCYVQWATEMTV